MQYRTLGRTGVQVSTLSLGAMNFGAIGHTTQEGATAIVDAALEAGVNLVGSVSLSWPHCDGLIWPHPGCSGVCGDPV